jgi:hypothetical protein
MVKVILISGKMGSGKTTLSSALVEKLEFKVSDRAVVLKFADPLYQMHNFCLGLLKQCGIVRDIVKDGKLLQLLGTEWGRDSVDQNIWVKMAVAKVEEIKSKLDSTFENIYIIIDDCRFKNELMGIPEALRVRLYCDREVRKLRCEAWRDNETHPSEIDLDDWAIYPGKFDLILNTNVYKPEECAEVIKSFLDQGDWVEKRLVI